MDNNKNNDYVLLHFEDAFPDGRLVDNPGDVNKNFRFRKALELSKELGRPLTEKEMKQFERTDNEEHHMCESMGQLTKESEELGKKNAIMVMIERFKKENPNATNKDVVAFVTRYSDLTKEEVESYL